MAGLVFPTGVILGLDMKSSDSAEAWQVQVQAQAVHDLFVFCLDQEMQSIGGSEN